ncbi:MAG: MATE family efflux transporter [Bulleidia sp.]
MHESINELETGSLPALLKRFCIPALISSLVVSIYNIVDQIFVGNAVGELGNAATNVVYPSVTLITALSLMCGVGTSALMNLALGKGEKNQAAEYAGNGFALMVISGGVLSLALILFTKPILFLCGCTEEIWPYAAPYARITALAFIFSMIGAAGPFVLRADGAPKYALVCVIAGNVLNACLDAILICGFHLGMEGAAWATVIGEGLSAYLVLRYLRGFRCCELKKEDFHPRRKTMGKIAECGAGPAFNFMTQVFVQILLNNALRFYGAASVYGAETVLAAVGVANKVNTLSAAVVQGFTNGMQPIVSYNYGRKNYERVKETAVLVLKWILLIGFLIFLLYQFIPVQILSFFGDGSEGYYEFGSEFFRTFYLLVTLNGLQSSVGGFFSAQGRPKMSILISMMRQVILLPICLLFLPPRFGMEGILWSGPLADLGMAILAVFLLKKEFRRLSALMPKA